MVCANSHPLTCCPINIHCKSLLWEIVYCAFRSSHQLPIWILYFALFPFSYENIYLAYGFQKMSMYRCLEIELQFLHFNRIINHSFPGISNTIKLRTYFTGHILYLAHFPCQGPGTIVLWGLIHICSLDESSFLIPAWISNQMYGKVWDEIMYPFHNFNGTTVEIWEWISGFIPHLIKVNSWYKRVPGMNSAEVKLLKLP